ncbi:26584_t:CDS:2, partial [Gigaspora margarita]
QENPSPSPSSLQMELVALLTLAKELLKKLLYRLTLSLEEILAPHKQKKTIKKNHDHRMNEISKEASQCWKSLSFQVKQLFTILAEIANKRYKLMYPDYVYKPQKKEDIFDEQMGFDEQMSFEEQTFSEEQPVFDEPMSSDEQIGFDKLTSFEEQPFSEEQTSSKKKTNFDRQTPFDETCIIYLWWQSLL